MTNFDDLSRGQQYLVLRDRDYETLIQSYRISINYSYYMMEHYPHAYSPADIEKMLKEIEAYKADIQYYSQFVDKGGAENEEPLTESHKDSESPIDTFKGVTCTTV